MQGTYLGIDESNHGRFPEIFVGVLSTDISDTFWKPKQFSKIRKIQIFQHY